jgi:Eukaryotic cytochrome b561
MSLIDWLLMPLSGAAEHSLPNAVIWHARLMTLAWGVIVPVGVLIARYWKIWPNQQWPESLDHKGWWHSHRFGQLFATVLMAIGVWLVWVPSRGHELSLLGQIHIAFGWSLMLCVTVQVVGGFLRGTKGGPTDVQLHGDHFDMTPRRRLFEKIHKRFCSHAHDFIGVVVGRCATLDANSSTFILDAVADCGDTLAKKRSMHRHVSSHLGTRSAFTGSARCADWLGYTADWSRSFKFR